MLTELPERWSTAVFLAVTTGLRVSELLALKWCDFDFLQGEIKLTRGIVRQNIGTMKTEASRKFVPLDAALVRCWLVGAAYVDTIKTLITFSVVLT